MNRELAVALRTLPVALVALGVVQAVFGEDLQRWLSGWSGAPAGRPVWSVAFGVALAATALWQLVRPQARAAALATAIVLLVPVSLHVGRALGAPQFAGTWLNVLKWLTLGYAPFVLHAYHAPEDKLSVAFARVTPWVFGAFFVISAYLHVTAVEAVMQLMPAWMPYKRFFAYLAGSALLLGGVGMVVNMVASLALRWSAIMLVGFFVLVHVPRLIAYPTAGSPYSELAEVTVLASMAILLAVRAAAVCRLPAGLQRRLGIFRPNAPA